MGPLTSVHFVDARRGWVVGGGVLATADGGSTWERQAVPDGVSQLSSIYFVDADHGWAAGGAALVSTADGGKTWQRYALPRPSWDLRSVHFADLEHGWAVGSDPFGHNNRDGVPLLLATADGGKTWEPQALPEDVAGLDSVHFVDAERGWVVGYARVGVVHSDGSGGGHFAGAVLATADGGKTWRRQTVPEVLTGLRSVDFVDADHGWAVGGNALLSTADGGKTWRGQALPHGVQLMESFHFLDARHGWAAGHGVGGVLLSTADGGKTWQKSEMPAGRWRLAAVAFTGAKTGWAVGEVRERGGGLLLLTADGGDTWRKQPLPEGVGALYSVHFPDADHGWAVGYGPPGNDEVSLLLATSDGGKTWRKQAPPEGVAGAYSKLYSVHFVDADHGWAAGLTWGGAGGPNLVGLLLSTGDGGRTWRNQPLPEPVGPLLSVHFADADHGCAVGRDPDLLVAGGKCIALSTADGGKTWEKHSLHEVVRGLGSRLYHVHLVGPKAGWAAGERLVHIDRGGTLTEGVLLATRDGGETWREQTVPEGAAAFDSVYFADPDHGWAVGKVGKGGVVIATSDGGKTWRKQAATDFDLTDVTVLRDGTGWAVGSEGYVRGTPEAAAATPAPPATAPGGR